MIRFCTLAPHDLAHTWSQLDRKLQLKTGKANGWKNIWFRQVALRQAIPYRGSKQRLRFRTVLGLHMTMLKPKLKCPRQDNILFCCWFDLPQHVPYACWNWSSTLSHKDKQQLRTVLSLYMTMLKPKLKRPSQETYGLVDDVSFLNICLTHAKTEAQTPETRKHMVLSMVWASSTYALPMLKPKLHALAQEK